MQRWHPLASVPGAHFHRTLQCAKSEVCSQAKAPSKHIGFFHKEIGGMFQSSLCTGALGMVASHELFVIVLWDPGMQALLAPGL